MILVDFHQVFISNAMAQSKSDDLSIDQIRHMVLHHLFYFQRQFSRDFGDILLCNDSRRSWRHQINPYYKETRARQRARSSRDWEVVSSMLAKVKSEIRENLPFYFLEIKQAEADDIIAVLAEKLANEDRRVLIVSGDKDFLQLHYLPHLKQYAPNKKGMLTETKPKRFLQRHIIKGDSSDGIPNIKSPINALSDGIKQCSVYEKELDVWLLQQPEDFCDANMLLRFRQNEKLIDLSRIPAKLKTLIISEFEGLQKPPRVDLYKYFMQNGLLDLMVQVGEFS